MKILLVIISAFLTAFVFSAIDKPTEKISFRKYESEAAVNKEIKAIAKKIISCSPGTSNINNSKDVMKMHGKKQYFPTPPNTEEIFPNDNKQTAGVLQNGILTVNLEARDGTWFPESHDGKGIHVFAFAEKGKELLLPGPQIRVPEGTVIKATIHNTLDAPLLLYGFTTRPATISDTIKIAPGVTYESTFNAGVAGTYFYRASASDSIDDGLPFFSDSQLYGAFIVDPPNHKPDPQERVIMIGIWNDTLNGPYNGEELVMNGMTWPYTERLTYKQEQEVNWRIINSSIQPHPMHLHGFYYTVKSKGNLYRDSIFENQNRYKAVTELLQPGETTSLQ